MSFTSWMRPRILLRSATALVAGAAVWLSLGPGNVGAATAAAALPTGHANLRLVAKDGAAAISSNWAGYAVTGSAPAPTEFTRVFAAWVQPEATCVPGQATYSAFWVGLGGYNAGSQALEQTGTSADCSVTGQVSYSAWYELVPAAPVTVKLAISAGDSIVASVAVSGRNVTVKITNYTTKKAFAKTLTMNSPDVSSAEWIAEAPSSCTRRGVCKPLPLTNFGTVTFVSASATAVLLHTGAISGPAWAATPISLDGSGGVGSSASGATGANAVATPTALSSDGSSFGVSLGPAAATTSSGGPAPPGP
jgi:hypothetical protein